MNPWVIVGLVAIAGGAAIAMSGSSGGSKATGLPNGRFAVHQFVPGSGARDFNGLMYTFDGKVLASDETTIKAAIAYLKPMFAHRQQQLPADASDNAGDKYSTTAYWFPHPHTNASFAVAATSTVVIIDEYGRLYDEDYSQSGMWANLWANPLFKAAVFAALAASGYGAVGYAALQAYQLRGGNLSLKDVALKAARTYIVSQYGPVAGAAFDMGVGVASGKDVDDAALDAAYSNMSPEQRAAFEQGRQAYRDVS